MTVEYVEKVYNRQAHFYDRIYGRIFPGRDRAVELLELYPGAKLLEVGVGTGLNLPGLPSNVDITGVDLSKKMLDKARKRVEGLGMHNVKLQKMDASRLDFPDDSFDRILAAFIVSVVPDPISAIEEMKRVCRPGGYILIVNHFLSQNPIMAFFERITSPLFYRVGFKTDLDLKKLVSATDLQIDRTENSDLMGHWKIVRCLNRK